MFNTVFFQTLYPVICELRAIKTEMELQALRFVARVSSIAHKQIMRTIKPGMKVSKVVLNKPRYFLLIFLNHPSVKETEQ